MADPADRSDQEVTAFLDAALAVRKPVGPKATGHCLYCESALPPGLRWCDSACSEDWEREQKALERNRSIQ